MAMVSFLQVSAKANPAGGRVPPVGAVNATEPAVAFARPEIHASLSSRAMLNTLWLALIALAVFVGGATGRLHEVTEGAFQMADTAVMKIALPLAGIMALWLGLMRLAERSGLVQKLARALRPVMTRLFPDVPAEHPAMG